MYECQQIYLLKRCRHHYENYHILLTKIRTYFPKLQFFKLFVLYFFNQKIRAFFGTSSKSYFIQPPRVFLTFSGSRKLQPCNFFFGFNAFFEEQFLLESYRRRWKCCSVSERVLALEILLRLTVVYCTSQVCPSGHLLVWPKSFNSTLIVEYMKTANSETRDKRLSVTLLATEIRDA